MSILPKTIYRFKVTPIKIPMTIFTEIEKNNSKILRDPQKTSNPQVILRKKNKARGTVPGFKRIAKL